MKQIKKIKNLGQTARASGRFGPFAEPVTFGFWLAYYASRLLGRVEKIRYANNQLAGKFAGPVGAYNSLALAFGDKAPLFEKLILNRLGLEVEERQISTQIVQPEPLARLMFECALAAGVMANLADDMRHLQRTEIGEVGEAFGADQVGEEHSVGPLLDDAPALADVLNGFGTVEWQLRGDAEIDRDGGRAEGDHTDGVLGQRHNLGLASDDLPDLAKDTAAG
jgi:hypothetical protein